MSNPCEKEYKSLITGILCIKLVWEKNPVFNKRIRTFKTFLYSRIVYVKSVRVEVSCF